MTFRLLCAGLATLDIAGRPIDSIPAHGGTQLVEGIAVAPAGTAGGAALVAATLGLPTALAGAIGGDGAARFVRAELAAAGVDTALFQTLPERRTSATMLTIRSDGERPNFHALGASLYFEVTAALLAAAAKAKFMHWGGVGGHRVDGGPAASLLAHAKAAGATVSCDLIGPGPRTLAELARLLPHVDYFMPNMQEACYLAETENPADAASMFLRMGAGTCVLKWGARGVFVATGGEDFLVPAHDIRAIDTTSCGDSFCAGFIAALDRGFALKDACRFGNATAALVAQDLGTLGKLKDFESTRQFMTETPVRTPL